MASTDPILTALTLMEGRLLQRMEEWRRDFKLDLDGRFGAIHKRLDYLGRRRKPPNAQDLREQVLAFRRQLGELEGRVKEIEGHLSRP